MRAPTISAVLILLIFLSTSSHSTAAEPRDTVSPATLHRILHLNNIAACLDCPALMVTDLDRIDKPPADGEKLKGPPPADAETIEILKAQEESARSLCARVTALFAVGAQGGESHNQAMASYNLCLARARLAWAEGKAAATLSWLEQTIDESARAFDCVRVTFHGEEITFAQTIDTNAARTTATLNAFAVRQSCEAMGYDLTNVDKQPMLEFTRQHYLAPEIDRLEIDLDIKPSSTQNPPQPPPSPRWFSTAGKTNRQRTAPAMLDARIDAVTLRRLLNLAKVSACLRLPVALSPDFEQLVNQTASNNKISDPTPFDVESLQILDSHLRSARQTYHRVKKLFDAGAINSDAEKRHSAAHHLCLAEARSAWANGDAAATVHWLDRANRLCPHWAAVSKDLYDYNKMELEQRASVNEAMGKTNLAALHIRRCCESLGFDLTEQNRSSNLAKENEKPFQDTTTISSSRAKAKPTASHRMLHLLNVTKSLDLPLGVFYDPSLVENNRRTPPISDEVTQAVLTEHAEAATYTFRRVYALHQVGAMGGEIEVFATICREVAFARAQLSWSEGRVGMSMAWLDEAAHWSESAREAMQTAHNADVSKLDAYLAAQDADSKVRLAARSVRRSCENLGYNLAPENGPPSVTRDSMSFVVTPRFRSTFWDRWKQLPATPPEP
jgi:hypothetical protein